MGTAPGETLRVLLVEDRPADAELVVRELMRAGFEPDWRRVENEADYLRALSPDLHVILSDLEMPHFDGLRALELLREKELDVPFILVSGTIGEEAAVGAIRRGASDYLIKDRLHRLGPSVRQALQQKHQRLERARMSMALASADAKYRDLFDNAVNGIYQTTPDGRVLTANQAMAEICGYDSPEDLIVRVTNLEQQLYVDPEDRHRFEALAAEHGGVSNFEFQLRRKEGSTIWVSATARAVRSEDGTLRYDGSLLDISLRKRAEDALRASQSQLLSFVEQAPADFALFDRNMVCLAASRRWVRDYGRGRADLVGVSHYDVHPDLPESWKEAHRRGLAGEPRERDEDRWVQADGNEHWLRWAVYPWRDAHGDVGGIMILAEDITERKRAEQRSATQHAVTRVLAAAPSIDDAASGIIQAICETMGMELGTLWAIDRNADVLVCSSLWHVPGLAAEDLVADTRQRTFAPGAGLPGRVWASARPVVVPDVARDEDVPRAAVAAKAGLRGALAIPILLRGEVTGVIDFLGPEMQAPDAELISMLAAIGTQIGQFIEHRRAEQQLRQSQKMDAVGQLAGGIAHDFNNLLSVIIGYVDLAARDLGDGHKAIRRIDAIRKAANRAAGLTRQILTFSRKQVVEARVLDLNHVVGEMETMLRRLIGEDVRLAVVLGDEVGRVRADPGQLEQVIMNLAVNARDAMPDGGRLVIETANQELDESHVRTHPEARVGAHVALTVSDTGEGMSRETQSRLFEPFFTTKEAGKGTGLGLAVVYGIVKQSGGSVSVYSELGHGTAFKIYLPRVEAPESKRALVESGRVAGGSETILLIEDEEALRSLFVETLRMAGYAVVEAGDPSLALKAAAEAGRPIQLLITDVVLPGQSGPETARQLQAAHRGLRVILMSGYTDRMLSGNRTIDPKVPFLSKPFTGDDLLRKVREVLDRKE